MDMTALYTILQPAEATQNPGFLFGPGIDYITLAIVVIAAYIFRLLILNSSNRNLNDS